MYQIKYRFIDSKGKTRKTALVTFDGDVAIDIKGTASLFQVYAAVDGDCDTSGKLTITKEYIEQGANDE